ncbi:MAG: ABC transporter ATP-binding protein [Chloroflexi bacterium]|nr:ABC transporter ATP-binding protein [Chloroflexota bacterium]
MEARFEGVRFAYGDHPVLDVPELRFAEGRVTALLGPNGSGKSPLLRLLAGLERPAAGRVLVGGNPAPAARDSVAYAFQEAVFLSGTLRANLDLALRLRGLSPSARRSRLDEAATACGVAHLLDRPANRLSGGEAQRANLARALSLRAPLTLLDEPLAGFDERGRGQMLAELPALLRRFAGTTVLVTHDRDEALRLAEDLVLLREGRLRAAGPRREVFAAPPDPETAAFLGYTLVPTDAGLAGVAPGGLRPGPGDFTLSLHVEQVVDLVACVEVAGRSGGRRIAVEFPSDHPLPAPGEQVTVSAPTGMVVTFTKPAPEPVDRPSRASVA